NHIILIAIHLNAVWRNINECECPMSKSKLIIFVIAFSALLFAEESREYVTSRTNNPPVIDGILDDTCWEIAPMSGDFKMHQPHDDRPASFDTEFAILYDNNNLYVAIRAHDPEPDKIYRQVARRDAVNSEFVALCLDSYYDKSTCYCFFVSASGVMGDVFISKDGESLDDSWNAIWWAKTNIDDKGWTAEYRIPLSQLRFVNKDQQIWGLDMLRDVHRINEESFWIEHKRNDQGFIHQFGTLRGLHDIKARKVLDIMPYAVSDLNTYEAEEGNPYMDGSDLNFSAGIDGKVGLTNNFTMDFTINPDFGQVEADPATVNLSAFETFFGERRPFFIEGNNITSFTLDVNGGSEQLFHSRRIGRSPHYWPNLDDNEYAKVPQGTNIIAAAKITGRTEKGLNIGVVEAVTQKEYADVSRNGIESREAVEPLSNYAVAALRQDFKDGKGQVGGIITAVNRNLDDEHLDFLHKQAYTGGLDLRYYGKDHLWQIDARTIGSYVQGSKEAISKTQQSSSHLFQRPDADWVTYDSTRTSLAGHGGSVRVGKFSGTYRAAVKVQWKSPGLELNDIGFIGQTDWITQNVWLSYRKTEPFSIFNEIYVNMTQINNWNFGGQHLNSGLNIQSEAHFKNLMGAGFGTELNSESLSATELRGGPNLRLPPSSFKWLWFGTDHTKDLHGFVFYLNGMNKDGLMSHNRGEIEFNWKISEFINITMFADWQKEYTNLQYVTNVDYYGDTHYILAQLHSESTSLQLGLNWNISPTISLEYRGRPFFMSGKYDQFKVVTDGDNSVYEDRFDLFTDNITLADDVYSFDEDRDMVTDYTINDPDFVYNSFQSNLVFRWEYQPGSTLFLVWSMNNAVGSDGNRIILSDNIRALNDEIPDNVFLVKVSYRLGR
ncbi:MAG: carbohydrate binding family 9 domain-containing protein, partial [Candidatus Marinimicrobia bacterium]|nr:carbohydrate binding family 9 domain-containing protein [Candidatus Neomarinimicrobiota bacterium]